MTTQEYFTAEEAAKYIRASQSWIKWDRGKAKDGKNEIPYIKRNKRVFYRRRDLDAFMESKLVTA